MTEPRIGVVVPAGPGRVENLNAVLTCLAAQERQPDAACVVYDGWEPGIADAAGLLHVKLPKHEPGMEQPRNVGVRVLRERVPELTHVWFLDSDVIVEPSCLEELVSALKAGPYLRIVVAPYDWLPPGVRPPVGGDLPLELRLIENDPRWVSFHAYEPSEVRRGDLAAGLACFSGNLLWPIEEFVRVGGFWSELHHGRCEDGELGIRAVAMDVGISFASEARGWHLWHEINIERTLAANERDVPMLNNRHPWMEQGAVFMVDRDGKAFDVRCWNCQQQVPTLGWWQHAGECGVLPSIPVR